MVQINCFIHYRTIFFEQVALQRVITCSVNVQKLLWEFIDLFNFYFPAMMLPTRTHVKARWRSISYHYLSQTVGEADIYRHMFDQSMFSKRLDFLIIWPQALQFLVMGIWKTTFTRNIWQQCSIWRAIFAAIPRTSCWLFSFSGRKCNFQNGVHCQTYWTSFKVLTSMLNNVI